MVRAGAVKTHSVAAVCPPASSSAPRTVKTIPGQQECGAVANIDVVVDADAKADATEAATAAAVALRELQGEVRAWEAQGGRLQPPAQRRQHADYLSEKYLCNVLDALPRDSGDRVRQIRSEAAKLIDDMEATGLQDGTANRRTASTGASTGVGLGTSAGATVHSYPNPNPTQPPGRQPPRYSNSTSGTAPTAALAHAAAPTSSQTPAPIAPAGPRKAPLVTLSFASRPAADAADSAGGAEPPRVREHAGGIIAGGVGKDCASNGAAAGANAKVHEGSAVAEVKGGLGEGAFDFRAQRNRRIAEMKAAAAR